MFTFNCHFLDSNILLGKVYSDNANNGNSIWSLYFKHEFTRYISNRVENESKNVITKLRRVSLRILKFVENYIINSDYINPIKVDSIIRKLKTRFLKIYESEKFPEELKREKFIKIVNDLFNKYYNGFRDDMIDNSTMKIESFKEDSKQTFKNCYTELDILISRLNKNSFYLEDNSRLESQIKNIGIHRADILILLDCYILSNQLNNKIAFITQDKEITSNLNNIKSVLNNGFYIFDPNNYLSDKYHFISIY
ncbi:MAG: hypothetical protein LBM96_13255 [Methanobrevibacter sp.]|jgi:hypothetical protein|nr:hypothetical protein [Candidatus Methanoflexus mossambicus]